MNTLAPFRRSRGERKEYNKTLYWAYIGDFFLTCESKIAWKCKWEASQLANSHSSQPYWTSHETITDLWELISRPLSTKHSLQQHGERMHIHSIWCNKINCLSSQNGIVIRMRVCVCAHRGMNWNGGRKECLITPDPTPLSLLLANKQSALHESGGFRAHAYPFKCPDNTNANESLVNESK